MYRIVKISSHSAVDYAAEELKKYLRMMMVECGEIGISYDPAAAGGDCFRLGLMQDFGLDVSDAEDPVLDDILYVDTDEAGGVIAGDNPRSVLLAVYEYLRQLGCRWLFPGVDGEFIPEVEGLKAVKYRHRPSCRYRGQCNEGAEIQWNMLEAIEFTPKVGLNVFMQEFRIPTGYYRSYYAHRRNEMNRAPEPVTDRTVLQWKRQCESEISKRGLQYHDMGHGWAVDPFGIDSSRRASDGDNDALLTEEQRSHLALVRGERRLVKQTPNFTQFCMSDGEARKTVVRYAADYAERQTHVDYLHIWLGDAMNRHCECDACRKKTPTDWYVILLNELDEELTRRNLDTRLVFCVYTDTTWAPVTEVLKNQKRYSLLLCPIGRQYTSSVPSDVVLPETEPYVLNAMTLPKTLEENFAYLNDWRKTYHGAGLVYEYHFWRHQFYDVGGTAIARVVNEDVRAYQRQGLSGIIQDGSQRSFFPTGLAFYTYARTLYDSTLTAEEIRDEYFETAFGEDHRAFYDYLTELGEAFDFGYMEGEKPSDPERSPYYAPAHAASLGRVAEIVKRGRELIAAHYNMPYRVQTVSVRLLERHARYAELLAEALLPKVVGDDDEADRRFLAMATEIGKFEAEIERCYDHHMTFYALETIFRKRTKGAVTQYQ